jgi:hypothetical protein
MNGLARLIHFLYYAFYPWLTSRSTGQVLTRSKIQIFLPEQSIDFKKVRINPLIQLISHHSLRQYQPTPGIVNYPLTYPNC